MDWKTSKKGVAPSGLTQTWGFWRHCCCRYGWFPFLLAPLVTVAMLFDVYSSTGCEFMHVDIGFAPSNEAWNQSSINVGLFQFQNVVESGGGGNAFGDTFWKECQGYTNEFQDQFIDGDRTWAVARIMAYISSSSAILGAATIWLFVFTPVPTCFFWPGIMMPSLMVAFLASGSKFLFFDSSLCRSSLWYPSGEESSPQSAQSCGLGKTAYYAIAASSCLFVSLIVVCFKSPDKRTLKTDYGPHATGAGAYQGNEYAEELASGHSYEDRSVFEFDAHLSGMDEEQTFDEEAGPQVSFASSSGVTGMSKEFEDEHAEYNGSVTSVYVQDLSQFDAVESSSAGEARDARDSITLGGVAARESLSPDMDESRYNPTKSLPVDHSLQTQQSMDRLAKMEKIQQESAGEAAELIDKCVADLEKQFNE